jgi:cell pole-organizing protein PopZ
MPTYVIEGRKIRSEKPLSDAEIDEIAASFSTGSQQQASNDITIGGGGMAERIPGQSFQAPVAPPQQQVQNPTMLDYGIQGAMAVPVLAAPARGLQMLARGSKAAPFVDDLARAVIPQTGKQLAFEGALGATAGVAAGKAAEQFEEETEKAVAGTLAGLAAGVPFLGARNAFDIWTTRGLGSDALQTTMAGADTLGKAQASAQAITALRANPNLGPTILRAQEIEKNTGVSLPMLAAANGDTTISSYLQSQTSRGGNAEFTAALKLQYEAAEQQLKQAKRGKAPTMEEVDAYVKRKAQETKTKNEAAVAEAQSKLERRQQGLAKIDERIEELTSTITAPGRTETGTALKNLLNAKETAIRSELSPQYDKLITSATEQGIKLPGEAARELRTFAADEMNRDVFQKFPRLFGLIKKEFSTPATTSGRVAEKYRIAVQAQQPKDVPLTTLDSLKREVNRAIRDTDNKDDLRRLYLLRDEVEKSIDAVDPAFSQPYRALDREYATRLGMPFREQGVVNIDRAQFVERTVPMLTTNPSALRQVKAIVGDTPEGVKIIEDAFLFKIANDKSIINTNTNQLNTKQLQRYLNNPDTKAMMDEVPGLRQRLEQLITNVDSLKANKARILEANQAAKIEQAENIWTQAYGTKNGMRGVVRNAMRNPQQFDDLLRTVEKDKVAEAGVKAALMEDVFTAPGDSLALFKDNRQAFEKLFGKNETNNLEYIFEASQRLKDNPFQFKVNINNISKTQFENITGSKVETSLGEMRNQVLSLPRVFLNHMSRFMQGQASKAESAEMQKFLSDPKALAQVAAAVREFESKGFTEKGLQILGKIAGNYMTYGPAVGISGGMIGSQTERPQPYMPEDPTLLEGFGIQ